MSDEKLYLQATGEVDSTNIDKALWAKAIALTDGDHDRAKYKYIKLRVEQLQDHDLETTSSSLNKQDSHHINKHTEINTKQLLQSAKSILNRKYIPIKEFSKAKGESINDIIHNIKMGSYDGQLIENEWHIEFSELNKSDILLPKPEGLTWGKFIIYVGVLYLFTLIGVLIKESEKINSMEFQSIWQYAVLAMIPVMYMFWFGVIAFISLLYNRFNIQESENFLEVLSIIYVIFALMRILSSQPI